MWYVGDVKSGLTGIKNQAKAVSLKHLEEKYPNVNFQILKSYYNIDKNYTYLIIEAREDNLTFSFDVTVNSKGEVNEEFEKNKMQFVLEKKITDIITEKKISDIIPRVSVYPNISNDNIDIYVELAWKEKLSKEQFLDRCLQYKEILEQSSIDISLYKFRAFSDKYYTLTLGKDEKNITKEEILSKKLIQVE